MSRYQSVTVQYPRLFCSPRNLSNCTEVHQTGGNRLTAKALKEFEFRGPAGGRQQWSQRRFALNIRCVYTILFCRMLRIHTMWTRWMPELTEGYLNPHHDNQVSLGCQKMWCLAEELCGGFFFGLIMLWILLSICLSRLSFSSNAKPVFG